MNQKWTAVRLSVLVVLGLAGTLARYPSVQAQAIPGYPDQIYTLDPREVALLPPFCNYTQHFREHLPGGGDKAVIDGWYARLGPAFHHLHHYCYGLMKTNRANLLVQDQTMRRFYLTDAITEYDYVIERSSNDFILLPEILSKKGENLIALGKGPVAVFELNRAIQLKDDYWPPYAQLSDYYKDTGDPRKAREVLEAGLARAPDAKALQRRLGELDSGAARRGSKR
jgi:tetratricopeptide (TPR) repeat protein